MPLMNREVRRVKQLDFGRLFIHAQWSLLAQGLKLVNMPMQLKLSSKSRTQT
uniref:Uncharacterized protein n=1 Tax=Curvibacter symbiont subsp. Hydra magnipapillata TaxID=667019 RepID=C9Y901_CURXX|nr:hypothetical protein Csp_A06020 [Curvibacter putative symbiont of Hydra magnipapillata]